MKSKTVILSGTLFTFFAILLGAFGAHGLKSVITDAHLMEDFHLAAQYQFYHGLALLSLGIWAETNSERNVRNIAIAFYFGIAFFSGSLYLLALTGLRGLGAITPFGGLSFMLGWLLWAHKIWREKI